MDPESSLEMVRSELVESKRMLADLKDETATGLDMCPTCFAAKFHDLKALGTIVEELKSILPPPPHVKRTSNDIINTSSTCWFCHLIHRFSAQVLPDEDFIRWCTEGTEVIIEATNSIWKAQFIGIGTAEFSEVTLVVRVKGSGHEWRHFHMTCYSKENLPSRVIDRTVSTLLAEETYAQKIGHWLSTCTSSHSKCAVLQDPKLTLKHPLDLINVRTREIVTLTSQQSYVALSFVWGEAPLLKRWPDEDSQTDLGDFIRKSRRSRLLPAEIPSLFADAITITHNLGQTYLWIDCFCIEQDNFELRRQAIENMDIIYSGAFITICVLDSSDVFSGIPGISIPHYGRLRAVTETATNLYYMTKYEYLSSLLNDCSWSSRGWPFQEGALSARRLCFHQQGVFLLCEEELFYDVMSFDESNSRLKTAFDSGRDYGLPFGINLKAGLWEFDVYSRIVTAYTQRKLTFEADALNAVTGVLRMITRSTNMRFIAGIPEHDILNGLLWVHPKPNVMNGPFAEMDRLRDANIHRRLGFPSWSWLGWDAPTKYLYWTIGAESTSAIPAGDTQTNICSVNDDGQTLYRNAIFLEACAVASIEYSLNPTNNLTLVLKTQSVLLRVDKVSKPDQQRKQDGDHWVISDTSGQPINIDNVENFHNDILVNFYVDLSTYQAKCSVNIHSCISEHLFRLGTQRLEFVMLQHWMPTFRNEPEKIHKDSWSRQPYDMSELAERVWVMAVAPNKDGIAERVGITWIPGQQWREAGPKDVTVRIM